MAPTADDHRVDHRVDHLVVAHGFTQAADSWRLVAAELRSRGCSTTAVDLPGHGTAADVRADLWQSANRLVDAGGPATYVGYSMGGRVALHAALIHPRTVERLVLIGATAGIDDDAEREQRRAADDQLARHIVDVGVERFVDEWLATPLFAHLTPEQAQRDVRIRNSADGLASSLRLAGTGTQEPLWNRLPDIDQPTLLLVGEHDTKFRAIAERMQAGLARAEVHVVAAAGHSVHLEQPHATVEALVDWLGRTSGSVR